MRLRAKKMMITALATVALGAGILIGAPFANADDGNGHIDPPGQASQGTVPSQAQVEEWLCDNIWSPWTCTGANTPTDDPPVPDNMKRDDGVSVWRNGQWVKYRTEDVTFYTTASGRKVARPVPGAIPIEGTPTSASSAPYAFVVGLGWLIWMLA
jgi:hypothetical protein